VLCVQPRGPEAGEVLVRPVAFRCTRLAYRRRDHCIAIWRRCGTAVPERNPNLEENALRISSGDVRTYSTGDRGGRSRLNIDTSIAVSGALALWFVT
jgi:hypothetical protein